MLARATADFEYMWLSENACVNTAKIGALLFSHACENGNWVSGWTIGNRGIMDSRLLRLKEDDAAQAYLKPAKSIRLKR